MKVTGLNKRIFVFVLVFVLLFGMLSVVFADTPKPTLEFTKSGVTYNKEAKLLRFNLRWTSYDGEGIKIMYSIDNAKAKKLGEYKDQNQQIIAHIYLKNDDTSGSELALYAVDSNGNKSKEISSEFQTLKSRGITIEDEAVPLSAPEGSWSLINLFLTALSVSMAAISIMLFVENRNIKSFKNGGKVKSYLFMILTILLAGANIILLLTTQNLRHLMVMYDNMTIAMLLVTLLSIVTTMVLAVRAFGVQSKKEVVKNN